MATFFRGAGIGTYWHDKDARVSGFSPHEAGMSRSTQAIIDHIKNGTTQSPYVSLTRSYSIAHSYAVSGGHRTPSKTDPAYIYQIEIPSDCTGFSVLDPIREILEPFKSPLDGSGYQHDGHSDFLIGVIDGSNIACLHKAIFAPPPKVVSSKAANLSPELEAIVCALRDAELLAVGSIPKNYITKRYEIFS